MLHSFDSQEGLLTGALLPEVSQSLVVHVRLGLTVHVNSSRLKLGLKSRPREVVGRPKSEDS